MNDLTLYNKHCHDMQTGDVLLYVGNSAIGKLIRWWTKTVLLRKAHDNRIIYSHGNLILRFADCETTEDRRWVLDARASGVYPVYLSDYLKQYDGQVYYYRLAKKHDSKRGDILIEAMTYAGKKYDFLGLFKNAIGLVSANVRALFCTESIFVAYRDGGKFVQGLIAPRPDMIPLMVDLDGEMCLKLIARVI
jgi:hypothetical protein